MIIAAGRMHFVKFETARIQDCIDFIQAKGLHRCWLRDGSSREVRVKATGGGAIRFAGERMRQAVQPALMPVFSVLSLLLRDGSSRDVRVKATEGGAIRFAGGWDESKTGRLLVCRCC
jgi:hypothetical protein